MTLFALHVVRACLPSCCCFNGSAKDQHDEDELQFTAG